MSRWPSPESLSTLHYQRHRTLCPGRPGTRIFPEREYEENPELRQFITDTAFDSQRLLFIGTYGVSYGYDQILLQSLSRDGETLVGSAAAYADPHTDDLTDTVPIVLVRVTFDGDPAERAELTVTSGSGQNIGGGEERTFEARTE